jgi:tRNA pseudouridine13 synthase
VTEAWRPPEAERALGLGFYATRTSGTGGRTKVDPEDFRVDEISMYPSPDPEGPYTVLRVAARNWEQHELARALAERLGLPPHALAWAGTKDRRAITEQLLSYRGLPPATTEAMLPGVAVREAYRARTGLALGHHFGNAFAIAVREVAVPAEETAARVADVIAELRRLGRFPNFFGPQRFGEVRPVTHRVGERMLRGDAAGAVELYLTETTPGESPEGDAARRAYAQHRDPRLALKEFPAAYRFERTLLDHLARGQDAGRALRALPRELRRLFVHAAQSLLFNRYLVIRHERGMSGDRPVVGDRLLRVARDGTLPGAEPIPVAGDNLEEARALVARDRAEIAAPLIGYGTELGDGEPGELLRQLLADSGLTQDSFRLPAHPDLASEGTWRPIGVRVPPIAWTPRGDEGSDRGYELRFALPKGVYATVLLREFCKTGAVEVAPAAAA